jgi:hypothetical protein
MPAHFQMYPKWKYHPESQPVIVDTEAEEFSLGEGWRDLPCGDCPRNDTIEAARGRFFALVPCPARFVALVPSIPTFQSLVRSEEAQPAPKLFYNFMSDAQR